VRGCGCVYTFAYVLCAYSMTLCRLNNELMCRVYFIFLAGRSLLFQCRSCVVEIGTGHYSLVCMTGTG